MKNKRIPHEWIFFLVLLLLFSCYSQKNKTEERAKERVTQFILLMATDRIEEAEKYLSSDLIDSGNKEFFMSSFDDQQLKDTTSLKIQIEEVYIPPKDKKNRAKIGMTIRNEKSDFTKIVSIPLKYEKGDWYIGS